MKTLTFALGFGFWEKRSRLCGSLDVEAFCSRLPSIPQYVYQELTADLCSCSVYRASMQFVVTTP